MKIRRPHDPGAGDLLGEERRLLSATRAGAEDALARAGSQRETDDLRAFFLHDEGPLAIAFSRSQIAEAFAHIYGGQDVEAYSAGSRPSGSVNPKAIESMKEIGYDLSTHKSKSLDDLPDVAWDLVATMGCGDECPFIRAEHREDWQIPDPKNMDTEEFRKVRDQISKKVRSLIKV
jgi:protein-tyrosine-phosphatase